MHEQTRNALSATSLVVGGSSGRGVVVESAIRKACAAFWSALVGMLRSTRLCVSSVLQCAPALRQHECRTWVAQAPHACARHMRATHARKGNATRARATRTHAHMRHVARARRQTPSGAAPRPTPRRRTSERTVIDCGESLKRPRIGGSIARAPPETSPPCLKGGGIAGVNGERRGVREYLEHLQKSSGHPARGRFRRGAWPEGGRCGLPGRRCRARSQRSRPRSRRSRLGLGAAAHGVGGAAIHGVRAGRAAGEAGLNMFGRAAPPPCGSDVGTFADEPSGPRTTPHPRCEPRSAQLPGRPQAPQPQRGLSSPCRCRRGGCCATPGSRVAAAGRDTSRCSSAAS